jgi:hypothetical protein
VIDDGGLGPSVGRGASQCQGWVSLFEVRRECGQNAQANIRRGSAYLLKQSRLSETSGALDGQDTTASPLRRAESFSHPFNLMLALKERSRPGNHGRSHPFGRS